MKTNDIKKGMRIKQANGWEGAMMDNKKGNTRMVEVEGLYTEIGSIYSHNIVAVQVDGEWVEDIEYTDSQEKCRAMNNSLFGG